MASMASPPSGLSVSAVSLTPLLSQALTSKDDALLERCLALAYNNQTVRLNTVRSLEPHLALELVRALTSRLARKPSRASAVSAWIASTVNAHAAYLANNEDAKSVLGTLQAGVEARCAVLPLLLKVQGQLDLLVAQIPQDTNARTPDGRAQPVATYDEGMEDEHDSDDSDDDIDDSDDDDDDDDDDIDDDDDDFM
mmetsp:Transcript_12438/g.31202  ORF Transcript_12438/g.31202 Transcript_12438/m.31202 type:complete len:196 (-) Transcript_12438:120-707(-)